MKYKMYVFPYVDYIVAIIAELFFMGIMCLCWGERPEPGLVFGMFILFLVFILTLSALFREIKRYKIVKQCMEQEEFVIGEVIEQRVYRQNEHQYRHYAICRYVDTCGVERRFESNKYQKSKYPFREGQRVKIFVDLNTDASLYYVYPDEVID